MIDEIAEPESAVAPIKDIQPVTQSYAQTRVVDCNRLIKKSNVGMSRFKKNIYIKIFKPAKAVGYLSWRVSIDSDCV